MLRIVEDLNVTFILFQLMPLQCMWSYGAFLRAESLCGQLLALDLDLEASDSQCLHPPDPLQYACSRTQFSTASPKDR